MSANPEWPGGEAFHRTLGGLTRDAVPPTQARVVAIAKAALDNATVRSAGFPVRR